MTTAAPELSPLFRSDAQGEILSRVLLAPDRAFSIAELAEVTGTSYATTHREVLRLLRTGVVTETRVGRHHQVRADTTSPAHPPLVELLLLTYGPAAVIPAALAGVAGIDEAHVYGSWAARRAGERGSPPRDVDVLVVGSPDRAALHAAAETAELRLGREVNIRAVSARAWAESSDPFLRTVRERPLIALHLVAGAPRSAGSRGAAWCRGTSRRVG